MIYVDSKEITSQNKLSSLLDSDSYTYLYAFEFLRSLAEFKHVGIAKLQRLAIIEYGTMVMGTN